jgi:TPP-dependent pyruvate/acetoin dehydrogenase alpha subunit
MNLHTKQSLIAFEDKIKGLWESGDLPSLVHLCGGNEEQLIEIFNRIQPEDYIFTSHRAHYHCLLKGMSESELEQNIREDRSMFVFSKELRIYQSAILGGCCGIATGVAKAIKDAGGKERVYCFLGDGAYENGHLFEAALYVTGHDLPCTFIIENNGRQVDTSIIDRRGPNYLAFSMKAPCIEEYQYEPIYPHAGSGSKHQITFKRTTPL